MRAYTGWYRADVHRAKYRMRVNQAARAQMAPRPRPVSRNTTPKKPRTPPQPQTKAQLGFYLGLSAFLVVFGIALNAPACLLLGFIMAVLALVRHSHNATLTAAPEPASPSPGFISASDLTESEKGFTVDARE